VEVSPTKLFDPSKKGSLSEFVGGCVDSGTPLHAVEGSKIP